MDEGPLTPEQREMLRQQRVMNAYRELFGANPDARSPIQKLVMDDLAEQGYLSKPVFVPDRKTGVLCPLRAAYADGRRSIALYVASNIGAP